MNVEVVEFKSTGFVAVYVGMLQVGKVVKLNTGWYIVSNEGNSYSGFIFQNYRAIEMFTRNNIVNVPINSIIGVRYVGSIPEIH